jgi:general secretion pathway protein N
MRVFRKLAVAAAGLAAIAAIGAWTLPADIAYRFFGERLGPLRLHDLSGSIWQGQARGADLGGYELGSVDWTLQFMPLLHGIVTAQVALAGTGTSGTGTIERAVTGEVRVREVRIRMPASVAAPVFAIPALQFLGTIEIEIPRARLVGMWLADVDGTATWHDAAVSGAAQARLGDLRATFGSGGDGAIGGVVADLGGPLEVAGTFRATIGGYQAQARIASRGDNPQIGEALQYIGQPQPDGSRQLLIEGKALGI